MNLYERTKKSYFRNRKCAFKTNLSDICSRWATGGILARLAGSRETSDFMSERSSSSWFNT